MGGHSDTRHCTKALQTKRFFIYFIILMITIKRHRGVSGTTEQVMLTAF